MRRSGLKDALALLEVENAILRQGEYVKLADLTARKERLIADLAGLRLSGEELRRLRDATDRNARMLKAALKGIAEAKARLAELTAVQTGLSTYDAQGGTAVVGQTPGVLERKA